MKQRETENEGDEDTWLFLPLSPSAGAGGIFLSVLVSWVKGEEGTRSLAETARGALAQGSG